MNVRKASIHQELKKLKELSLTAFAKELRTNALLQKLFNKKDWEIMYTCYD